MKKNKWINRFIVVSCFVLIASTSGAAAEKVIVSNFKSDGQGWAPWCWASAAGMALRQRANIRKETCELVSEVLEKSCCGIFRSRGCFVGGWVSQVFSKNGFNTQSLPATTEAVVNVIRSDRVAILGLNNTRPGGMAHVAVVYGIENIDDPKNLEFLIYDSALGRLRARPDEIRQKYVFDRRNTLRWTYTQASG